MRGTTTRGKRTFSRVSQKQLKGIYAHTHALDQFPFRANRKTHTLEKWTPHVTTEAARKDVSKLVRLHYEKGTRRAIRAKATREGRFVTMLFNGATKSWNEMEAGQQARYMDYVLDTLVDYAHLKSRRTYQEKPEGSEKPRRKSYYSKTKTQIRKNILPEVENVLKMLEGTVENQRATMDELTKIRLRNKISIFEGIRERLQIPNSTPAPTPENHDRVAREFLYTHRRKGKMVVYDPARVALVRTPKPIEEENQGPDNSFWRTIEETTRRRARVNEKIIRTHAAAALQSIPLLNQRLTELRDQVERMREETRIRARREERRNGIPAPDPRVKALNEEIARLEKEANQRRFEAMRGVTPTITVPPTREREKENERFEQERLDRIARERSREWNLGQARLVRKREPYARLKRKIRYRWRKIIPRALRTRASALFRRKEEESS